MDILVPIIIGLIILVQIIFFTQNLMRMREYGNVFVPKTPWEITKSIETGFVRGISGAGNKVFNSIVLSINEYLRSNSGSVIDFHLLKDAVDRHCDTVENDINVQTPIPLYCGLAGTMAGVILGLAPLISSGALIYLLSGNIPDGLLGLSFEEAKVQMDAKAASGINELLTGVAWAMVASICGLLLTTINSILFKHCKLKEESGKNQFLAWMQSRLLPELPSDTSDALNRLVTNLNAFNQTFAENTSELRNTLTKVNESYRIQADIIKTVHDMDVMQMAQANVRVLTELKECTDKLETFNEYLNNIQGYTDVIHTFTEQFEQESNRLHVLEEIRDFFTRHRAEISRDVADADTTLRDALDSIRNGVAANVSELNTQIQRQSEEFKRILEEEKNSFEQTNQEMVSHFRNQLSEQMPTLINNIEKVTLIPTQLDKLIERIELSNKQFAREVTQTIKQSLSENSKVSNGKLISDSNKQLFPTWMNWIILIAIGIITIANITNTVFNVASKLDQPVEVTKEEALNKSEDITIESDTTEIKVP